jgi:hypothetical protein
MLTLNDLKKHIFHLAYDATDFYVSTARSPRRTRADHFELLVELLLGGGFEPVVHRMRMHAERSAGDFQRTVKELLDPP